ncbi:DUF1330 domain-containing protein [Streptomyces sp. NPDC048232]|uniref:DUF1330 domain-containing protein n=1 Tax=Streptomyces sp. NPDC048232 TaxID=3365520 RepID=UPI00370FFD7B
MLNLLRFAPDGRASYEEYSRRAAAFLRQYGGELLYAGDGDTPLVAAQGQAWDAVLLVRYTSREAFSRMVADPGYREITSLRSRALDEASRPPRGRDERGDAHRHRDGDAFAGVESTRTRGYFLGPTRCRRRCAFLSGLSRPCSTRNWCAPRP